MAAPVPGAPPTSAVFEALTAARRQLASDLEASKGPPRGFALARAWSDTMDATLAPLLERTLAQHAPRKAKVGIAVTGGYGRRELSPSSDLDLLVVTDRPGDPEVKKLSEALLYPLWDLKLECGHAVRAVSDAVALAKTDLATATALLDVRWLAGDRGLVDTLEHEILRSIAPHDANEFVARLRTELSDRHAKFGDALFLLEPNLKHGRGGLRDLATGLWAARARWRVRDFPDLLAIGTATARQVNALCEARDFMLGVRAALHLAVKRRQDQLLFELQEHLAPSFYPDPEARPTAPELHMDVRPAVAREVEALMRAYYLHARAVVHETERLLDRALVSRQRKPSIRRIDATFTLWNGQLSVADPQLFRDRPSEMLRLFRVALAEKLPIYGHTKEVIAEVAAELAARGGAGLTGDPEAARHFLALLTDPEVKRDPKQPSVLEEIHELGLLNLVMPEFSPCTGRVQHDLYHVFTVDQHQLYAVARLKELARGELAKDQPQATAAIASIEHPLPLYLGTLLHDVGKPLGKGHSEKGAQLAHTIGTRLGMGERELAQTEFLVRQHLVMAHLSQRRDMHDVAMIANFAAEMGDEETLRQLYLLTLADMSMVAPGNLSEWKDRLLRELYTKTLAFLRRGPDLLGEGRGPLVAARRQRVAELLDEPALATSPELTGLTDRYFTANSPRSIARHIRLARRRRERGVPVLLEVKHRARRGYSELSVTAADVPGLLAKVTGVLLAARVDIVGAQVSSRAPLSPGEDPAAIDVFGVRDRYGRAITDAARWAKVEADLAAVLAGAGDVEELVAAAARREATGLRPRVTPRVATEIEVDNEVSREYSVIDVYTHDRLGVLYAITRTLFQQNLDIALSKVATEADRVADVFYVRDRVTGGRLTDEARIREVSQALTLALAEVGGSGGGPK